MHACLLKKLDIECHFIIRIHLPFALLVGTQGNILPHLHHYQLLSKGYQSPLWSLTSLNACHRHTKADPLLA